MQCAQRAFVSQTCCAELRVSASRFTPFATIKLCGEAVCSPRYGERFCSPYMPNRMHGGEPDERRCIVRCNLNRLKSYLSRHENNRQVGVQRTIARRMHAKPTANEQSFVLGRSKWLRRGTRQAGGPMPRHKSRLRCACSRSKADAKAQKPFAVRLAMINGFSATRGRPCDGSDPIGFVAVEHETAETRGKTIHVCIRARHRL
jgi:hypothetical protein